MGIEIIVSTDCREIIQRLPDIAVRPEQEKILTGRAHYEITRDQDRYRIFHKGESFLPRPHPDLVIIYLQELINYHFRMDLCPFPAVHSGSATLRGKTFILVGEKGAGKTTLIGKLLFSGADVHGDEYVLINGEMIVPYPRKFHLKPGTMDLLPQLSNGCRDLKPYPISTGGNFFFFDPSDAGKIWQTKPASLDAVFYLEPNHGRPSLVEKMPKIQLIQRVMHQVDNFPADPSGRIRSICDTINRTGSFLLRIGDLDQAVELIEEILS